MEYWKTVSGIFPAQRLQQVLVQSAANLVDREADDGI
jgi:hypothetical protein